MKKLIILSMLLSGCSTAQMVRENKDSGRVLIYGSRGIAAESGKEKAQKVMAQKCPKGYEIVETGQMATGSSYIAEANMSLTDTNLYYDFKCK